MKGMIRGICLRFSHAFVPRNLVYIIWQRIDPPSLSPPGTYRGTEAGLGGALQNGCQTFEWSAAVRSTSRSTSKAGGVGHELSAFVLPTRCGWVFDRAPDRQLMGLRVNGEFCVHGWLLVDPTSRGFGATSS